MSKRHGRPPRHRRNVTAASYSRRPPKDEWDSLIREVLLPMLSHTEGYDYQAIRRALDLSTSATLDVLTAARRMGLVKCKGDFMTGEWRLA
jgi:hypothetical protein